MISRNRSPASSRATLRQKAPGGIAVHHEHRTPPGVTRLHHVQLVHLMLPLKLHDVALKGNSRDNQAGKGGAGSFLTP